MSTSRRLVRRSRPHRGRGRRCRRRVQRPHPETGTARLTTYVHLRAAGEAPEHWTHVVTGAGEDADLRFACSWIPLPVTLAGDQHELLWRLDE